MPFGKNKGHMRGQSGQSIVMQLGNGQLLITVPKILAGFKGIRKGAVLKWSDGGPGRLILEQKPAELP